MIVVKCNICGESYKEAYPSEDHIICCGQVVWGKLEGPFDDCEPLNWVDEMDNLRKE